MVDKRPVDNVMNVGGGGGGGGGFCRLGFISLWVRYRNRVLNCSAFMVGSIGMKQRMNCRPPLMRREEGPRVLRY